MMPESLTTNKQQTRAVCCVILFACFALFFNLGGRTLENIDYLHYAEIGREILETGDWVVMHNAGNIYVDKPPLHSIDMALSFKLFGINPFAARFPSALFALLGVVAVLVFGIRIERGVFKTGIYAALFLLSSYGYFFLSRRPRNDIEYSVLFTLGLIFFYEGYEADKKSHKLLFYALFWSSMGFAALVKGPAALLPLVIIGVYLLVQRGWRQAGGKSFFITALLLPAVVLPYLVLLYLHKDFAQFVNILQHRTIMTRKGGILYYIPVFFEKFAPAALFLLASSPVIWRERAVFKKNPRMAFALTWAGIYLFSIHLVKAKVYRYLLPAFPPLSIIAAWGTQRLFSNISMPVRLWRYWQVPAGVLGLGGLIAIWAAEGWSWTACVLCLAAMGICGLSIKIFKDPVAFICICCVIVLLFIDAYQSAANTRVSDMQNIYNVLHTKNIQPEELLTYKTKGRVPQSLSFYFNRVLRPNVSEGLKKEEGIKAVITNPACADEVTAIFGTPAETRLITEHRGKPEYDRIILFYK